MKVKTLIKMLSKMPQNITVLVDGYEGGYTDDIVICAPCNFYRDYHSEIYYGPHEAVNKIESNKKVFRGLVLSRC